VGRSRVPVKVRKRPLSTSNPKIPHLPAKNIKKQNPRSSAKIPCAKIPLTYNGVFFYITLTKSEFSGARRSLENPAV
jgi:hypothetical protein